MDPNGTDEHIQWTIGRRAVETLEVRGSLRWELTPLAPEATPER